MKKSLPIRSISFPLQAGPESAALNLGRYVSDRPVGTVQRVQVRRRAIRIPDGRIAAALRAYRESASLS
ncbi:MAG: hypothetical protein JW849_11350 [Phycisphaerae bacterium]|nr:hypothetical protein [Phycisphaerae bacterium]